MNKLDWCKEQAKGISIVEPNPMLSASYIKEADYNMLQMVKVDGKLKVVLGYYACYSAIYSLLMKVGIKCEIHDCTLALIEYIPALSDYVEFISELKKKRIDVQYYLKEEVVDETMVKKFVNIVKNVSDSDLIQVKEVCHGK